MTRFYCTTCCKIFEDKDIKWWNNSQVCERCYQKYLKYQKNDTGYPKNRG